MIYDSNYESVAMVCNRTIESITMEALQWFIIGKKNPLQWFFIEIKNTLQWFITGVFNQIM